MLTFVCLFPLPSNYTDETEPAQRESVIHESINVDTGEIDENDDNHHDELDENDTQSDGRPPQCTILPLICWFNPLMYKKIKIYAN